MDRVAKVVLDSVEALGFDVKLNDAGDTNVSVSARNTETGETFIVRVEDPYIAACDRRAHAGPALQPRQGGLDRSMSIDRRAGSSGSCGSAACGATT